MDQSNFINYKKIKQLFDYSYKGYNLQNIIPGYLNFVFDGDKPSLQDVAKAFLKSYQILDLTKAIAIENPTLITYLIRRTDYKDLANETKKDYPHSQVVNLESLSNKKILPIGFTYIKHLMKSFGLIINKNIGSDIVTKLYYVALTVKILNQISLIEKKTDTKINQYICFNSAYREEALLTLYFNKRNIETISMQHGIFCNFKQRIPFDIINEDNFIANKLLCWGQYTIDYLTQERQIKPDRLLLVGNPKYKHFEIEEVKQSFQKCLVLLGRGYYLATNNKLLELLTQYNKTNNNNIVFYIKKHPFLPDEEHRHFANIKHRIIFLGKEHSTKEVLESDIVDFCIAVNTTAYYESLAMGKPCLRWTESENEDFYGMDDKFDNIESFSSKLNKFKNMSPETLQSEIKQITRYVFNPHLQ